MKKIFLGLVLVGLLIAPAVGLAQLPPGKTNVPEVNIAAALVNIMKYAFGFLLFIAAIFIIVSGYYWVTAGGDAAKVATARSFLIYALIGVAVAFLARGLISVVGTIVNVQ